jgi:hypothetical protein
MTMPLEPENGKKMLQLLTSRYNDRHWRKKIEKILSLTPTGIADQAQRAIFLYLKHGLKGYKSRRADPDSWIVGGFATTEVIQRAKLNPTVIGPTITKEHVADLAVDPGPDVDEAWWEDMLVEWFETPDSEVSADVDDTAEVEASDAATPASDAGTLGEGGKTD